MYLLVKNIKHYKYGFEKRNCMYIMSKWLKEEIDIEQRKQGASPFGRGYRKWG
jgi:hypothetical protein